MPSPQTMTHGGAFRNCHFPVLPHQFTMAKPWLIERAPSRVSVASELNFYIGLVLYDQHFQPVAGRYIYLPFCLSCRVLLHFTLKKLISISITCTHIPTVHA